MTHDDSGTLPWPVPGRRREPGGAGRDRRAAGVLLPASLLSLVLVCVGTWMVLGEPTAAQLLAPHSTMTPGVIIILFAVAVDAITVFLFRRTSAVRIGQITRQRDELRRDLLRSAKLASIGEQSISLAHDVNTILAALGTDQTRIMRALERLDPDDEPHKALIRSIESNKRQVERCSAITSKLVGLGRTKNVVIHAAKIVPILHGIKEQLCQRAIRHGIVLRFSIDPHLPRVKLDVNELEIVLTNLVNNAMEAICGSGWINIIAWRAGDEVLLSVQDSGTGIASDDLERVFQPFFSTKSTAQATGLGLSVSHEIVTGWGGVIEVQSEPGKGTEVTIRLPIHQPRLQEDAASQHPTLRTSSVRG